jgi:hypothetical protein
VCIGKENELPAQLGVIDPAAKDVEEIDVCFFDPPGRADGIVVRIARRNRNVPALNNAIGIGRTRVPRRVEIQEALAANQVALQRRRPLLVLGEKEQAADFAFYGLERDWAFPFGMQRVADTALVGTETAIDFKEHGGWLICSRRFSPLWTRIN